MSIKNSDLYNNVLKEINYSFADIFICEGYIVSEIKSEIVFTWDNHAKIIAADISKFLGTDGSDLIYISNRIASYTVMATDWLKFFKNSYSLKGYYVVGQTPSSMMNSAFENLFLPSKIKRFTSLSEAIKVAQEKQLELTNE